MAADEKKPAGESAPQTGPTPGEVVELLQALLAGGVVLDRSLPQHARSLEAACAMLGELESLRALIPALERSGERLTTIETDVAADSERLLSKIGVLEELYQALDGHLGGLRRRAALPPGEAAQAAVQAAPAAPLEAFEGVVAIDVGTSNAVCARWDPAGAEPEVVAIEPVAVNVVDPHGVALLAPGAALVGEAALAHPSAVNLYRSFRRALGGKHALRPAVAGKELVQVAPRALVTALVDTLLRRAARGLGHERMRFPHVVLTVPASGDLALEYEVRRALERLDVTVTSAIDEASAACVAYLLAPVLGRGASEKRADGKVLTPGERYLRDLDLTPRADARAGTLALDATVLCVDTGGGTTDLALLELDVQQDAGKCQVHIEVRDTTGFPDLSGEGLTLSLFELLKRRLALALAHPRRALLGRAAAQEPAPRPHPWLAYHKLEAGPADGGVELRLEEDLRLVESSWDAIAGREPLRDAQRLAVDRLFPTTTLGAPKSGRRFRSAWFRWLWEEAERLKRAVSDERTALAANKDDGDPLPTVRARLDLAGCPTFPHGVDLLARIAGPGIDREGGAERRPSEAPSLANPREVDALCLSSRDIDVLVERAGLPPLLEAVRKLTSGRGSGAKVHRLLLAGGGTHATRAVVVPALRRELGLKPEQVVFDPAEAKRAVARGACLWAVGTRLEGIEVLLEREPRCPVTLVLQSAVSHEVLFTEGQAIKRFSFAQPPHREGAEGDKLIMVGQEVGGRVEPCLMFDPRKGTPLPELGDLPILRRKDVVVKDVDAFLQFDVSGSTTEFFVRDPTAYTTTDEGLVPQWELFHKLRQEMSMTEVIAWLESAEHLRVPPPQDHAFHRYYLDEDRELYLVFHAQGRKLLCRGQVARPAQSGLPVELDPFSGVH